MNRRQFLAASGATTVACSQSGGQPPSPAAQSVPAFEFDEVTFDELRARMASGAETARSITEKYLARIERIDQAGPTLNAVIEINPDAIEAAEALDEERRSRNLRGPLHGVPILIKDNIDTADRMMTTAGSLALEGSIAAADSGVAQALRRAGAVILGKTNLSEWANFRSYDSTSGWSGRGGQTHNPYALDRNPCGSSSGSGAAAAANLCAGAIGTETNGSVICPSSINGIVGVKPTVGLISRAGIIPIAHTQDTAGPMCRTVRDAAILLGALAGVDVRDEATEPAAGRARLDYTEGLTPGALRGARIGVVRSLFGNRADVDAVAEENLAALRDAGAELVEIEDMVERSEFGRDTLEVLLYEFKTDLNAYLAGLGPGAPVKSLAEVIAFNEANADRELPFFDQKILIDAEAKGPLSEPAYLAALEKIKRLARAEGIDKAMAAYDVEALAAPSTGPAWATDLVHGDHSSNGSSSLAAIAGYPHITVPGGFVRGLPVGFSFFGAAWSEPRLLSLAYAFEQATRHRRTPELKPSLGLGAKATAG